MELFHELPKEEGSDNLLLFYFAAHGQTEGISNVREEWYNMAFNAEILSYASSAISIGQIRSLSSSILEKHILLGKNR